MMYSIVFTFRGKKTTMQIWCLYLDSNQGPSDYDSAALPLSYTGICSGLSFLPQMVSRAGLEPAVVLRLWGLNPSRLPVSPPGHMYGGKGGFRDLDTQGFNLLLYHLSYFPIYGVPGETRTPKKQRLRLPRMPNSATGTYEENGRGVEPLSPHRFVVRISTMRSRTFMPTWILALLVNLSPCCVVVPARTSKAACWDLFRRRCGVRKTARF